MKLLDNSLSSQNGRKYLVKKRMRILMVTKFRFQFSPTFSSRSETKSNWMCQHTNFLPVFFFFFITRNGIYKKIRSRFFLNNMM